MCISFFSSNTPGIDSKKEGQPEPLSYFEAVEGVLLYSPSTVQSFLKKNTTNCTAYCIGETTAKEAKRYFNDVRIAKIPTIESVIEMVNEHYIAKDKKND